MIHRKKSSESHPSTRDQSFDLGSWQDDTLQQDFMDFDDLEDHPKYYQVDSRDLESLGVVLLPPPTTYKPDEDVCMVISPTGGNPYHSLPSSKMTDRFKTGNFPSLYESDTDKTFHPSVDCRYSSSLEVNPIPEKWPQRFSTDSSFIPRTTSLGPLTENNLVEDFQNIIWSRQSPPTRQHSLNTKRRKKHHSFETPRTQSSSVNVHNEVYSTVGNQPHYHRNNSYDDINSNNTYESKIRYQFSQRDAQQHRVDQNDPLGYQIDFDQDYRYQGLHSSSHESQGYYDPYRSPDSYDDKNYSDSSPGNLDQEEADPFKPTNKPSVPYGFKLSSSKSPIVECIVFASLMRWGIELSVHELQPLRIVFRITDFDYFYTSSDSICAKTNPGSEESRLRAIKRYFTNFPMKRDRSQSTCFDIAVRPEFSEKVNSTISYLRSLYFLKTQ